MNRLTASLTAAALAAAGLFAADATTAAPQPEPEKAQLAQLKLQKAPTLKLNLLCSPKYKPSSNAKTASRKGGMYTCTYQVAIPPGTHCKSKDFDAVKHKAELLPGGKYVRVTYICQSHPW